MGREWGGDGKGEVSLRVTWGQGGRDGITPKEGFQVSTVGAKSMVRLESKLRILAELYFRSQICQRGLVFFVLQILDRRTILSIKPTKCGLKILYKKGFNCHLKNMRFF